MAILLQAIFALAIFASCVSDKFWEKLESSKDSDSEKTPYYLSLKIMDPSGESISSTRAVGSAFEDGTEEHKVGEKGNYVILLNGDANRSLYTISPLQLYEWPSGYEKDEDKEAIYTAKFYHDEKEDLPQYCLVVLNANENISKWLEKQEKGSITEDGILKKCWYSINDPKEIGFGKFDGETKLFTLTNSAYMENNEVKVAEKIEEYITKSLEEARRNHATVYVERMVAKFEFKVDGKEAEEQNGKTTYLFKPNNTITYCTFDADGSPIYKEINYQIRVTGWNINALETESYLFKNVKEDENYFYEWNKYGSTYHHLCWAEDPHYIDKTYPWQFRKAVNNPLTYYMEGINKREDNETVNNNLLWNYSFNELNDNNWDKIVYTPENTYDWEAIKGKHDSRENLLAGTHLIVCAQLETDLDEDGEFEVEEHLYRDRTGVFYKDAKDCFWGLVRSFNYSLQSQIAMQFTSYDWKADKGGNGTPKKALAIYGVYDVFDGTADEWDAIDWPTLIKKEEEAKKEAEKKGEEYVSSLPHIEEKKGGAYVLYHKDKPITYGDIKDLADNPFTDATIKDGDGKMLPWLGDLTINTNDEKKQRLILYNNFEIRYSYEQGKSGRRVVVGNKLPLEVGLGWAGDNERKSLLLEWVGAVDYFKDGRMYYAAPVRHNDLYSSEDLLTSPGDCGVVRNHLYKFKLNDIKKIGTSVYRPDDSIVPNKVTTNDQLNITVDILDWHTFETTAPML